MMILLPGTVLYLVSSALIQLLGGRGKPEIAALMLFCAGIINAGFSWLLIPATGINGAAIAATTGYIVLLVSLVIIVKAKYGIRIMKCLILNKNDVKNIIKTFTAKSSTSVE